MATQSYFTAVGQHQPPISLAEVLGLTHDSAGPTENITSSNIGGARESGGPPPPTNCDIIIRPGILREVSYFGHTIVPRSCYGAVNFLITDSTCDILFGDKVFMGFRSAGLDIRKLVIPTAPQEESNLAEHQLKNRRLVAELEEELLHQGVMGSSCIISLGGSVVSDVCSVLAGSLLGGVSLVHLVTSTLGALDATINAASGVERALGRSAISSYRHASTVVIDPSAFESLPQRNIIDGLAMAMQAGLCCLSDLADAIVQPLLLNGPSYVRDAGYLEAICRSSIESKLMDPVGLDDANQPALQYGRALGAAIESLSWKDGLEPLLQGEAVAIGMCISAEIARLMGLCDAETVELHYDYLHVMGLPTYVPANLSIKSIVAAATRDGRQPRRLLMSLACRIGTLAANGKSLLWEVSEEMLAKALELNMARCTVAILLGQVPQVLEASGKRHQYETIDINEELDLLYSEKRVDRPCGSCEQQSAAKLQKVSPMSNPHCIY